MMVGDIGPFVILRDPNRLQVKGDINTTLVTAADMLSLAEWALAIGRQLLNSEAPEKIETLTKGG